MQHPISILKFCAWKCMENVFIITNAIFHKNNNCQFHGDFKLLIFFFFVKCNIFNDN